MSIGTLPLTDLAPLAVMLPVLGAAVTFMLVRRPRAQITVTVSALVLTLVLDALLLASVWDTGVAAVHLGGWPAPLGISLVVDRLSALMLVVSALITLAVLLYASAQGLINRDEGGPVSIFHPTFLILVAGVSNAFLAGDLFNLYVGFEILLTSSYVLLTMGGTAQRIRAGVTYVVVSVLSSVVFLIAIAMIYAATGTVNMADLAVKLGELPTDVQMVLHVLLLVGFGIKAAVFPLSFWLPDSYPTAPAPVTAVFAGLLTKVGVYAMIRTETLLFPGEHVNALLLVVAALTMVVGILGALAQTDIKRILSFILVSHIGYMIFGLGLATEAGLAATVYYVAHHITVQTALFLVTGLIENRAGTANIDRLGSLAKVSPFVGVLFLVPALNLGGIPPFSGFLGKVGLLRGGVEQATPLAYTLVGVSLLVSLLTLLVVVRVWTRAFWRRVEDVEHPPAQLVAAYERAVARGERPRPLERGLVLPTTALVGLTLVFTVAAGPLFALSDDAATDMLDRSPYIAAVLDDAAAERAAATLSVDPTEVHNARK
ncbi:Na+/H+ antiporter subunit D [Micrococcus luteus]|uniref:Na+/H+ antiporter subunit D n=1 Tax=Micrococcus luteus TaxID=1270 RepID=UPI0019104D71|nr:Na+/H+ antiporter subunit D [Micrococcus luteus]QQE48960.1 Na+/H+ antiporter subunit D [Micrococcus luteus]